MPTFGEAAAADPWAASSRTLTAFAAADLFDLPAIDANYPGVTVSSSATLNTFGSWRQLVADVGAGKRLIGVVVLGSTNVASFFWEMEFGEGAAPNEAAVTRVGAPGQYLSNVGRIQPVAFWLWKSLTSSARLSARAKISTAGPIDFYVAALIA